MITSKQRAYLRSMANQTEPIVYVGKAGITDNLIEQVSDALVARELIKGSVQENCPLSAKEALRQLCEVVRAEPVQAIGRKFGLKFILRAPFLAAWPQWICGPYSMPQRPGRSTKSPSTDSIAAVL